MSSPDRFIKVSPVKGKGDDGWIYLNINRIESYRRVDGFIELSMMSGRDLLISPDKSLKLMVTLDNLSD